MKAIGVRAAARVEVTEQLASGLVLAASIARWLRRSLRLAAVVVVGTACCGFATAPGRTGTSEYPKRPIKLIVGTTAGSLPDVIARLISERLAQSLGQPVVVEDRPGALGTLGLNAVTKAPPDGYTLGLISMPVVVHHGLIAHAPYDIESDLAPIAMISRSYQILSIRSNLPARSVTELIALAKAQPGALKYSSPGNGTPGHIGMKLFEHRAAIQLLHVPYQGGPAAVLALLRGDVDLYLAGMLTIAPYVRSGAVRPLATFAPHRLAANPETPTMSEVGYPDVALTDWQGVVAPSGTPADIIERLSEELTDIVTTYPIKQRLEQFSAEPAPLGPLEFRRLMDSDTQRWDRFVRENRLRLD